MCNLVRFAAFITSPEDGKSPIAGALPGVGYDALAAAPSRAVARLSRDIADTVHVLDRTRP